MEILTIIFVILVLFTSFLAYKIGHAFGSNKKEQEWQKQIPLHRQDAINRSRLVLSGKFSESLAPFLPDFKYSPTECRFLGSPIDLVVFKGADNKEIDEVIFVEVKSGNSNLSTKEKSLKKAIQNKKVKWEEYRVPKSLTEKKEKENNF